MISLGAQKKILFLWASCAALGLFLLAGSRVGAQAAEEGITMRDQATGAISCVELRNGVLIVENKECGGEPRDGLLFKDMANGTDVCLAVRNGTLAVFTAGDTAPCPNADTAENGIYLKDMATDLVSCVQMFNSAIIVNGECISASGGGTGGDQSPPQETPSPPPDMNATSTPETGESPPAEPQPEPQLPPPPRTLFGVPVEFRFERALEFGDAVPDVRYLQIVLNANHLTRVSASGAGSPGEETQFFGEKTREAVIAFQELYREEILSPLGLSSGTGAVGPSTRLKLNQLLEPLSLHKTPYGLLNRAERASGVRTAVENEHQRFLPDFFEKGLIFGAIINEIGGFGYNNEWIRPNKPSDFGRGIMQITTNGYVGAGIRWIRRRSTLKELQREFFYFFHIVSRERG